LPRPLLGAQAWFGAFFALLSLGVLMQRLSNEGQVLAGGVSGGNFSPGFNIPSGTMPPICATMLSETRATLTA